MMSEKRFVYGVIKGSRQAHIIDCHTCKSATIDVYDDNIKYFVDKLNEQQATIQQLQDLCGKSDGENMKLRIENKRLQKELNDCEKFRYTVFKRLNDEHIKECSIR